MIAAGADGARIDGTAGVDMAGRSTVSPAAVPVPGRVRGGSVAPMLHREAYPFEVRGVSATDRRSEGTVRWQVRIGSRPDRSLDSALVPDCHRRWLVRPCPDRGRDRSALLPPCCSPRTRNRTGQGTPGPPPASRAPQRKESGLDPVLVHCDQGIGTQARFPPGPCAPGAPRPGRARAGRPGWPRGRVGLAAGLASRPGWPRGRVGLAAGLASRPGIR
jgi:hypothetical protein